MDAFWSRYRQFILSMVVALIVMLGFIYFLRRTDPPKTIALGTAAPRPTVTPSSTPTPVQILVDVRGAVVKPDIYKLPKGSRVEDALNAAGGASPDANLDRMNMVKTLSDGEQIVVPTRAPSTATPAPTSANATPASASVSNKININAASAQDLDKLPGIGPALAQRIIDYRNANGPFKKIEDLKNVSGIGDKLFDQIKDLITVQ